MARKSKYIKFDLMSKGDIIEQRNDIAASLFLLPCKEEELFERDFLKNTSQYGIQLHIRRLEQLDALYYKGEVMYIKKKWAMKNLREYDLDFRTEKEKYIDGLSDFERAVYGL
jgi:hypothetical protein